MSASIFTVRATHPTLLDDELVALSLQLEETGLYGQNGKGKYPAGSPPDVVVAFDSFHAEIEAHMAFLKDLRLAHSIAQAVETDAQAIAELIGNEEQVQEDWALAWQLDCEEKPLDIPLPAGPSRFNGALCNSTAGPSISKQVVDVDIPSDTEATMAYAETQANAFNKMTEQHECTACYESYRGASIITLECRHTYCLKCLKEMFLRATVEETRFPPRCCRAAIPVDLINNQLSPSEVADFRNAEIEFSTKDRTYCSNSRCGKFICPADIQDGRAVCERCAAETCTMCKNRYHKDGDCPADHELQDTLSLATDQGWQRCYSCKQMVELDHGCHHMTCTCGAHFCYVCGKKWRTCQCPKWQEDRLYQRTQRIVQRDAPPTLPQANLNQRAEQVRERLQRNPGCVHPNWTLNAEVRPGTMHRCELCAGQFRSIHRCIGCHMLCCPECRRHQMR